jgi:two-component system, cell cycle sensor histidine kinase and response regulator CckA
MPDPRSDWEHRLLAQPELYRQILDAIADMVLVKGAQSRILWANKAFRDYYGMSNEQLLDIIDAPFNEVDYTAQYVKDDLHVYTTGEILNIAAEPVTRHDGEVNVFHTVKSPLRDSEGQVRMTVGVSRNITEQKRIKEDLARHREHLERLVAARTEELRSVSEELQIILTSLAEGIIAVDATGRVQLLNPAAEAQVGWQSAEAQGRELAEVLCVEAEAGQVGLGPWDAAAVAPDGLWRTSRRMTGHVLARDRTRRLVALSTAPLIGVDGTFVGAVLVLRDIALQREVEEQRQRHERLESVGLLAGGIAHDFNNILTGVLGSISVARLKLARGRDIRKELERAEAACVRAQGLTRQLLTFSKGGAPVKKVVRVAGPVREAAELALRGSTVKLELSCAADVDMIEADEGQLAQVINNLVLNAKQAMPGGGRVTIAVANRVIGAADGLPLDPGPYVQVTVSDHGEGIAPEHLSRIFDPYFTTKENGSGLGLASVHSIIRRHGGHVAASSTLGAGAHFAIYLPAASCPTETPAASLGPALAQRALRILVLDDDSNVRKVLSSLLPLLGHDAVILGRSADAFAEFDAAVRSARPFDVVFVDLTMPGDLGGEAVIARLREREPTVKVVVMSGYSTSPVMAQWRELGLMGALEKPFDAEAVRTLLARPT